MSIENRIKTFVGDNIRNPRHVIDAVLSHDVFSVPGYMWQAVSSALVSRFDASPSVQKAVTTYQPKHGGIKDRLRREMEFFRRSQKLDLAIRGINGYRHALSCVNSQLGEYLTRVYSDMKIRDHGHDHFRRVRDFVRLVFQNSPEIKITWDPVIDAIGSFAHTHDIHQALVKVWNQDRGIEMQEKDGHEDAAAIMRLVTFLTYAKERNIPEKKAWEISAIDAFFHIDHDGTRPLREQFAATKRADATEYVPNDKDYSYDIDGRRISISRKLIEDLEEGTIDIKTLSPQQIMQVMIHKLSKNRTIAQNAGEKTRYGLLPDFEQSNPMLHRFLAGETIVLADGTKIDFSAPLFNNLTDEQKESMNVGKALVICADRFDMFAPFLTLMRKLSVQRSTQRPFFAANSTKESFVSELDGNQFHHSDTHRQIYEIMTVADIFLGTGLENSLFLRKIIAQHQLSALMQFKNFGRRFMRGDKQPIEEIYAQREFTIARKILRKMGFTKRIIDKISSFDTIEKRRRFAEELILMSGKTNWQTRYAEAKALLEEEKEHLIQDRIMIKPENQNQPELYDYQENVVAVFEAICNHYLNKLRQNGELDQEDILMIEAMAEKGENPPLGNSSYDSTGRFTDMKTLMGHQESVLIKLLLNNPQIKRMLRGEKFVVEKKRHLALIRKDAFERFGFQHLLGHKLSDLVSPDILRRFQELHEKNLEPKLIDLIDRILNQSPNATKEMKTFNRYFMLLGFEPGNEKNFQSYAWAEIEIAFDGYAQRFQEIKEFIEFAYSFHEKRRTGDSFINHPLALALLEIIDRRTNESSPKYNATDREDIEDALFHDLFEDMERFFGCASDGREYFIFYKEDPKRRVFISHNQYLILDAWTRKPGRDEAWLNQIVSLPLFLRARLARGKQFEIVHNLYTGQYKTYLEAIQRTEEQERTLIVLAIASIFSLRHPFKNLRDAALLLAGNDLDKIKILAPSFCASRMKELYYLLAERELIGEFERAMALRGANQVVEDLPSAQIEKIARLLRPVMYRRPLEVLPEELDLLHRLRDGRNLALRVGDNRLTDLYPSRLLSDFWSRNGIFPIPEYFAEEKAEQNPFPLGIYTLNSYLLYMFVQYYGKILVDNPHVIGSLGKIYCVSNLRTKYARRSYYNKIRRKNREAAST